MINILGNDLGFRRQYKLRAGDIVDKAIELVEIVKEEYPDATIIFIPAEYHNNIRERFAKMGGEAAGYYVTSIPMDGKGKSGHPSVDGHSAAAAYLTEYILSIIAD